MGGVETLSPCAQVFAPPAPSPLPVVSSAAVDLSEVAQVALPALQKMASQEWQAALCSTQEIRVTAMSGAMTNKVFECKWKEPSGKSRRVLVRLYGSEAGAIFSREQEVETFERLSTQGYGPQLLARFPQGRVEEWLHARTLTAADLRDPTCSARIAAKLAEFHRLSIGSPPVATVWSRLRSWLGLALGVADLLVAAEFRLTELEDEIAELEEAFGGSESGEAAKAQQGQDRDRTSTEAARGPSVGRSIGFCHMDLQYSNVMEDERTGAITIIDYEYAGYNPVALDIGNHFCEFAADYHSDRPHLLDYSRYPTLEERTRFCHAYLAASGASPPAEQVESLVRDADQFTLVSHLHWALWGLILSASSTIDFDYIDYARQRLRAYFLCKESLLSANPHLPPSFGAKAFAA